MEKEVSIEKNVVHSPTSKKLEGNTVDVQKKDQALEDIKSLSIGEDDCKKVNDSGQDAFGDKMKNRVGDSKTQGEMLDTKVQHDAFSKMDGSTDSEFKVVACNDLGRMDDRRDLGSKAQGEKLDDNMGKMDESRDSESKVVELDDLGKMDGSRDLESKARGEKLDDNMRKMDESRDLESKVVGECDDMGKMNESRDLESKARGEKPDDNMGKMDESRDLESGECDDLGKMDEGRDLESKARGEKLDDNIGKMDDGRDSESKVVERDDLCKMDGSTDLESKAQGEKLDKNMSRIDESKDLESKVVQCDNLGKMDETDLESEAHREKLDDKNEQVDSGDKMNEVRDLDSKAPVETNQNTAETIGEEEKEQEPVFDGTEVPGMEANRSMSTRSPNLDSEVDGSAWPEKAVALKNFVKEKGVAVTNVLRRLSGKNDENEQNVPVDENMEVPDSSKDSEVAEVSQKTVERSSWNPLNYIKMSSDNNGENKVEQREEVIKEPLQPLVMKGRIILYTRLGCPDCKEFRLYLQQKRLRYVEINIDIYPGRKLELEKISGSSSVPKVFFNEILIGGLSELKSLDESGKLDEKIDYLINEVPSFEAPLPPLSGEDDMSTSGAIDELALVVLKMKDSVVVKDRFYKMRRFTSCFTGSDAVNFLSEDQYLEREEAVEFGRKLASNLFFQHVLDENLFEDGNHLYRFLDHDPFVSQCQNIPRGIIDAKPKPITEISSRLRYLSYAIFEAYVSVDGRHVDYRSIHGSEEFARYLRTVQELQRVELRKMSREEKLAFFINLYNMMVIHAILLWGHPVGALERRKMFGDFNYVIGGCTYSLSSIQNGILRGNQRPPYNLMKPFGAKDKRSQVALPYPEPPIHFALVCGTRSGPVLRCYSPGNIDKELMEAARDFLRGGSFTVDLQAKVASISKILKWFSVDFGKNEAEVLKHASNYLEPTYAEPLLELLANSQLKVIYQPYDWGLNC